MTRRTLARTACALAAALFPSVAGAQSLDVVSAGGDPQGAFGGRVADGGDRVVFASVDAGLVPGDTNGETDLFLRRRAAGTTERISVGPGGRQADGGSFNPDLSGDGRWLAFCSMARNLQRRRLAGPDPRSAAVYLRDLRRERTWLVSRRSAREPDGRPACAPSVSRDGRFVTYAFDGAARRHVALYDRGSGRTRVITRGADHDSGGPTVSPDGAAVVFGSQATTLDPADTDLEPDVYRHGIRSRRTERVSAGEMGVCAPYATASRGGRFIAFGCDLAVYIRDHRRGVTQRLAPSGELPRISADGARVAFQSVDPLVPGGSAGWTETYTVARATGVVERVARRPDGSAPDGHVLLSDLSDDGRWIAFSATSALLGFPAVSASGDVFVSGAWPP